MSPSLPRAPTHPLGPSKSDTAIILLYCGCCCSRSLVFLRRSGCAFCSRCPESLTQASRSEWCRDAARPHSGFPPFLSAFFLCLGRPSLGPNPSLPARSDSPSCNSYIVACYPRRRSGVEARPRGDGRRLRRRLSGVQSARCVDQVQIQDALHALRRGQEEEEEESHRQSRRGPAELRAARAKPARTRGTVRCTDTTSATSRPVTPTARAAKWCWARMPPIGTGADANGLAERRSNTPIRRPRRNECRVWVFASITAKHSPYHHTSKYSCTQSLPPGSPPRNKVEILIYFRAETSGIIIEGQCFGVPSEAKIRLR